MAEERADFDFNRRNGEEEDDIFKSAVESPMTDTDQTLHGEDEIDLNDDDDDDLADLNNKTYAIDLAENEDEPEIKKSTINEEAKESKGAIISAPEVNNRKEEPKPEVYAPPPPSTLGIKSASVDTGGSTVTSPVMATVDNEPQFIKITVTEPQKQGEGMSAFIVYKVVTSTNIALFRKREFAAWRRFSDFLGLHSKLEEKHLKKGRIVPPAPEKNVLGTTKVKMGNQGDSNTPHSDFVEKRRAGLERFMNRLAAHSVLCIDPDFRDFVESDSDLPRSHSTSAFSSAGVARFLNRVGDTVNKISFRMDESDPWFEEKVQNIEALESQLRKVHTSIEILVMNRKELAHSTESFAKSAAVLSNADEHTGLARALAKLAEVEDQVEQLHNDQANSDFFLFSELLKDYIGLIGTVKDVFHERVKMYQNWQHAQQMLNKKREAKTKMELQGKTDRIAQAREEVVEWEGKVETYQQEFNSISSIIKKEVEQFEVSRIKEFKLIIVKYLESMLTHQQELVKHWEAFLPEAKAIL